MNDSFGSRRPLQVGGREYRSPGSRPWRRAGCRVARLPYALRILLENLLRHEDGAVVTRRGHRGAGPLGRRRPCPSREIAFMPARVLLQDFTGVPAVVDLAAMRDAMARLGGDPTRINPLQPVELVIDHSVQVDEYGSAAAFLINAELRVRAQPRALRLPALGPEGVRQLPGRAAGHRHRPPGQPRVPGARGHGRASTAARPGPTPTPWSAPTRTPR